MSNPTIFTNIILPIFCGLIFVLIGILYIFSSFRIRKSGVALTASRKEIFVKKGKDAKKQAKENVKTGIFFIVLGIFFAIFLISIGYSR